MTTRSVARVAHALTAAVAGVGVIWQLVLVLQGVNVLTDDDGSLPSAGRRVVQFLSFFTIESNILVAIGGTLLALHPDLRRRGGQVVRLMGLIGIAVTGIIFATVLRTQVDLHGAAAVTNALLHYVSPAMALVFWVLFGPRPRLDGWIVSRALIWPLVYMVYIVVYGAFTDWYPYPFVDVVDHGYLVVVIRAVLVLLLLVGIAAIVSLLDRHLPAAPGRDGDRRAATSIGG